jgi:heme/copper-type cytochrome/quinol oxidase subunit 4
MKIRTNIDGSVITKNGHVVKKYKAKYLLGAGPMTFITIIAFIVLVTNFIKSTVVLYCIAGLMIVVPFLLHTFKASKLENYFEVNEGDI